MSKNIKKTGECCGMTELCSFCDESFPHFFALKNTLSTSLNIVFLSLGKVYFVIIFVFDAHFLPINYTEDSTASPSFSMSFKH